MQAYIGRNTWVDDWKGENMERERGAMQIKGTRKREEEYGERGTEGTDKGVE